MRFKEFLGAYDAPLDEQQLRQIYDEILPMLMIEEDGGGGGEGGFDSGPPPSVPDGHTEPAPTTPTPIRGPGIFRPGGGFNGNHWFNQLYNTLKVWAVSDRISKRLKQLGVKGAGVQRIQLAKKTAAKHVSLLLSNPGATAYKIPVWTTKAPPKPVIKMWNEEFAKAFAHELGIVLEANEVSDRALEIAAQMLGTKPDDLERVSAQMDDAVAENGKQHKRQLLKSAGGNWFIVHYEHKGKKYARIEAPDKAVGNKTYQVATKTGPAELT